MNIKVTCQAPKYAKGEYEFERFEDLYRYLSGIKGLGRGQLRASLYQLAKTGIIRRQTAWCKIDIDCDFCDYDVTQKLGLKTGPVKMRSGDESFSRDGGRALEFAKEVDKYVYQNPDPM